MLAVILFFSVPSHAISARSAILLDVTTNRILFEKDIDQKSLIASTTKIMTALLICERCNVLDRMRIPKEAVGIEGSSVYLQEGEVLTIQELLYGMMLHSGNDAAVALAIYCGGTIEGFAQMMNDKAKTLGMVNTNFENPNGLDSSNHYSTAHDLAILAAYAMENPVFATIVSTRVVNTGNRHLVNHNKLLWQLEGADGVKTGYTKAAGRILVSSAKRQGRRLVAVTISDPNDWVDHITLMESGYYKFSHREIVYEGQNLGSLEIAGGELGSVDLIAQEHFSYLLEDGEQVSIVLPAPGFVYAPIAEGQSAGEANIFLNDRCIGTIPLVYGQTVEQKTLQSQSLWERLLRGKTYE